MGSVQVMLRMRAGVLSRGLTAAGGFIELPDSGMEPEGATRALADDLRFVQQHLQLGGHLRRLDHVLVVYRCCLTEFTNEVHK